MRIAVIQKKINADQLVNMAEFKVLIDQAILTGARVIVTQEAVLSGYPPTEIATVESIDFAAQSRFLDELMELARLQNVYLAIGLIRKTAEGLHNSIALISTNGDCQYYDKRALWGWDTQYYCEGFHPQGMLDVDGIKLGFRICFEVRFPEYFRELYLQGADIMVVSFCDQSVNEDHERLAIIQSHLVTRAVENAATVISVNGVTHYQTAPTCMISPEGYLLDCAPLNQEGVSIFTFERTEAGFGRKGRIQMSDKLLGELGGKHPAASSKQS